MRASACRRASRSRPSAMGASCAVAAAMRASTVRLCSAQSARTVTAFISSERRWVRSAGERVVLRPPSPFVPPP